MDRVANFNFSLTNLVSKLECFDVFSVFNLVFIQLFQVLLHQSKQNEKINARHPNFGISEYVCYVLLSKILIIIIFTKKEGVQ